MNFVFWNGMSFAVNSSTKLVSECFGFECIRTHHVGMLDRIWNVAFGCYLDMFIVTVCYHNLKC